MNIERNAKVVAGSDGFHLAFRYRDPSTRMFVITTDIEEAERLVGDDYGTVRVHMSNGLIDRVLEGADDGTGDDGEPSPTASGRPAALDGDESLEALMEPHDRNLPTDGIGVAYRYMDPHTGEHRLTSNQVKACIIGSALPQPVWAFYEKGEIRHIASKEEHQMELEVLIGERIAAKLTSDKLREFDQIREQDEATRWLQENCPDYYEIVSAAVEEMRGAYVLDGDDLIVPKY